MLKDFSLLNDESMFVAYQISTSKIYRLTKIAYEIISGIQAGVMPISLAKNYNLKTDEVNKFIEDLDNLKISTIKIKKNSSTRSIDRITIHVSNDCNLVCTYCYAKGGNYNMGRKFMRQKTADDLVSFLKMNFDEINQIVFFGGEPLLNYKIIKRICQSIFNNNTFLKVPKFNIITNGTILNQEIIDIINDYIGTIVVSIDGPQKINDFNRKFKDGRGSFSRINYFINTLKEKTKVLIQYEATYTNEHFKAGYLPIDIGIYLKKRFKINGSVVDEMPEDSFSERSARMLDESSIRDMFFNEKDSLLSFDQNTIDIVLSLAKGYKRTMCPVGTDTVAITVDGEIMPCHVLINESQFSLGNIYSENIFVNKKKYLSKLPFLKTISQKDGPCLECWLINICGGCVLRWFYDFKDKYFSSLPQPNLCKASREYAKNIILNLARLQSDSIKFDIFVKRIANEMSL